LVDTVVWRRYFSDRGASQIAHALDALLDEDGAVLVHPAVVGELVLGGLSANEELLLRRLPHVPEASSAEVLQFIRDHQLARCGIGWEDSHLLASASLASAALWSLDKKLAKAAAHLKLGFRAES
jgi:hypothetical protein